MRKPTAWSKIWIYGFLGARVGEGFRIFFFFLEGDEGVLEDPLKSFTGKH